MEEKIDGPKPIKIYNTKTEFIFTKGKKGISYNKTSKLFSKIDDITLLLGKESKSYDVYSILGLIEAKTTNYIICANKINFEGKILNASVFRIEKFIYIPEVESPSTHEEDIPYLKMLDDFLLRNPLYYSANMDLTLSIINMTKKMATEPKSHIFKYTINHFCWNYSIAKCLDSEGMNEFIFPVINGFFGQRDIENDNEDISSNDSHFILIARKDDRRSGMRFLIRGADSNGNVANSVETEEIITFKDKEGNINICSFLEIRGSIPIIWEQEPNFQLNPKIKPLDDFGKNCEVFKIYIEEMFDNYGDICCINLIDKKKDQDIIGKYYNNIVQNYKSANKDQEKSLFFVWFDFHSECKNLKYENISILFKTESMKECLDKFGFTHVKYSPQALEEDTNEIKVDDNLIKNKLFEIIQTQKGVFRNNCIDSLDRSNVVQSVIGRYFLLLILSSLGFTDNKPSSNDVFKKFKGSLEPTFNLLWADHGDCLSMAYSGTGALKSDFVRTGKRTLKGALWDGYLSCKRFYLNNFRDGYNQDCHDYFLGALNPKKKKFNQHSSFMLHILFSVLVFFTYFIFAVLKKLSMPRNYELNFKKFLFQIILFFGAFFLSFLIITNYTQKMFLDFQTRYNKNV